MKPMFELALFALLVSLPSANADCFSDAVYRYRDEADITALLTPTEYIQGSKRQLLRDYGIDHHLSQAQLDKEFGATGTISCNGMEPSASASVVLRGDVVITVGHNFTDPYTCVVRHAPKDCVFTTSLNGQPIVRHFSGESKMGLLCPMGSDDLSHDWAVLRLSEPLPKGIEPYQIGDSSKMAVGDKVQAINAINFDFFEPKGKAFQRAKSIASCDWGPLAPISGYQALVSTGCSATIGGSGSALLQAGSHKVVAIFESITEDFDSIKATLKVPDPNHHQDPSAAEDPSQVYTARTEQPHGPYEVRECKYDIQSCSSYYQPISGDFLNAIQSFARDSSVDSN